MKSSPLHSFPLKKFFLMKKINSLERHTDKAVSCDYYRHAMKYIQTI